MKHKIYYLSIVAILAAWILPSCKKEKLSPLPQTSLLDKNAFATPDRMLQQVLGAYAAAKNGNFLGGRGLVYQDVRGEDWLNSTGNGVTALGVWNFSITSTDNQTENFWSNGYAAINRANVVLQGLDDNPGIVPTTLANQYRGEMRFLRAVDYFYLLSLYEKKPYNADNGGSLGLPLRVTAYKTPEGADMARSTVAEVYNQILNDLNFAETNLPSTYAGNNDSNVVRAHKNAAIALKTRVYLHMGRYADVITEANKLVPLAPPYQAATGVKHKLASNFVNVFRAPYTDLESIFSFPMLNTNPPGTQNGLSLYENAEFYLNPAGILADAGWKSSDARKSLVTTTAQQRYTKFNDDNNNYVPIIRYAEVMLNLAEALARINGLDARAVSLLNAVRQRSDATTTFAPATADELINMILNERRIEFLGEGFRSLDIMRQVASFPAKGSIAAVPPSAQAYVWPIPASELLYNHDMVGN